MHVNVNGKQLDVGEALRTHVQDSLSAIVEKYFGDAIDAAVTIAREANGYTCDVAVHIGRDIYIKGHGRAQEPYPACDQAAEHLAKRLRRYKRRLRDHQKRAAEAVSAPAYVLDAGAGETTDAGEDPEAGEPAVIAEMSTAITTMSVSDAVMRLDLADMPALMFRNAGTGGLNMVYRRHDGHVGWVDPQMTDATGEELASPSQRPA